MACKLKSVMHAIFMMWAQNHVTLFITKSNRSLKKNGNCQSCHLVMTQFTVDSPNAVYGQGWRGLPSDCPNKDFLIKQAEK